MSVFEDRYWEEQSHTWTNEKVHQLYETLTELRGLIHELRQDLDFEKARRVELERYVRRNG